MVISHNAAAAPLAARLLPDAVAAPTHSVTALLLRPGGTRSFAEIARDFSLAGAPARHRPPLLARFQGTALAARVSGVWESLRSLATTDPLLVPLYCAPLCALKVLWRALGLSHSNAGLALRHFHRSAPLARPGRASSTTLP